MGLERSEGVKGIFDDSLRSFGLFWVQGRVSKMVQLLEVGGQAVGEGRRGFEGQGGFMVQHEISGLRPETTQSDTFHELERWLPVNSEMMNALCVTEPEVKDSRKKKKKSGSVQRQHHPGFRASTWVSECRTDMWREGYPSCHPFPCSQIHSQPLCQL